MRARTEATGIEVPPHVLHWNVTGLDLVEQLVVALLTNRTADDFANLWEEDVGTLNGLLHLLTIEDRLFGINLHVERLDLLRIVGHDDRLLEVLLDEVTLVLAGQVVAPVAWKLELLALLDCLLEDFDALGVRQVYEAVLQDTLQTLDESRVNHLVKELQVFAAVVQCPTDAMLDEVLLQCHQVVHIVEGHLRLNHPELGQVARRVAVLGTECRSEGIDLTQSRSTQLALQLTGDGQRCHLAEEIVVVDDAAVLVLLQVVKVLGRNLEHLACALAIGCRDERSMEIVETMLVEVLMDGDGHVVTDAQDCTEQVRAWTKVSLLTQELQRMALLLQRILVRVAIAQNFDGRCLNLARLIAALAGYELADDLDAGTRRDTLQRCLVEFLDIGHNLNATHATAVIEGDELHNLVAAHRTHPATHGDFAIELGLFENGFNDFPFHLVATRLNYSNAPIFNMLTSCWVR